MDNLLKNFNLEFLQKNYETINLTKEQLENAKKLISENKADDAIAVLEECKVSLSFLSMKIKDIENNNLISNLISKNQQIKKLQDDYAETYSKNQSIKKDSVKRNERIKIIDQEIESWKNLLNNSEKMVIELNERKNKQNLKLNQLEKQPQTQAEKKGQISENLRISEKEKNENEILIEDIDKKIIELRNDLNITKENSIETRERKASSGATIEGLNKRRSDLLERVMTELNLNENNLLDFSDLEKNEDEIFTIAELEKQFSVSDIQKSGAVFDIEKLNWMNSEYLTKMPLKEIAERSKIFFDIYDCKV